MAGHDYLWLPSAGGDVGVAANWSDTGGASNGTLPGSADEGEFANSVGGTITGNITVFEWIIDPGAGLNTFVGDTTARFFEVNANTALDGNWIQNGSGTLDQIYIAAGTLTLGSGAELISKATGANALGWPWTARSSPMAALSSSRPASPSAANSICPAEPRPPSPGSSRSVQPPEAVARRSLSTPRP